MTKEVVVLGGIAQTVNKLRLADEPENGLHGADIALLLGRIIIGSAAFPWVSSKAFMEVLEGLDVEDVGSKVIVSDIPRRTGW